MESTNVKTKKMKENLDETVIIICMSSWEWVVFFSLLIFNLLQNIIKFKDKPLTEHT